METKLMTMLTPCPFHSGFGGVQVSARIAWDGIAQEYGERARMIGFGPGCSSSFSGGSCSASRFQAGLASARARFETGAVLCWHAGLLKLIPLIARPDIPVGLFLHGVEIWKRPSWLERKLLGRVTHFFSNSDFTWRRFVEFFPPAAKKPHRTVALGMDSPAAGTTPLVSGIALMLGRVVSSESYKGHAQVIDSWPLVRRSLRDAELWVAGGGDALESLKIQAAQLAIAESVRFFGVVPEDEKARLLAGCSCLVLPSRGEGFGLVYLEAMRLGKACLVSTLDAGREVVQPPEAGLAADPSSRSELAGALVRLLTPGPESEAMGERARLRYSANFTAAHFQARLIAALADSGVWR